jgi:cell division protein FtsA
MSEDRTISGEDVRNVMKNAKAVNIPLDNVVVHAVRQQFFVDGKGEIQNPVGLMGVRLEADVHVMYGVRTRLQNTIKCIKEVPLDIQNIALSSMASALAVTTEEQRQLGALVIDLGAGTSDFIVYRDGRIQHSGVFAVGGDHVTNDIATGLKIPMPLAEQLKIEHGRADYPVLEDVIQMKRGVGLPDREISKDQLCRIMNLRVEETLTLIQQEVAKRQLLDYLNAGVILTGGCARARGVESVAMQVFGLPVQIGRNQTITGPTQTLESPEYSTAIGLVHFGLGFQSDQHQPPTTLVRMTQAFHGLVQKVRSLF